MSDFKAEMHQIRFWMGSAPDTTGALRVIPRRPIAWIYRTLILMGGEEKEWVEKEGREGGGKVRT